jgi:DNA repair ATPase RecN
VKEMKKIVFTLLIWGMVSQIPIRASAQANEAAQLALNIEKLAQFKSILTTLKKGYDIVSTGYGTVKDLTEGNFNLHQVFLDGLLQVSPAVKKYRKVALIVDYQLRLVKECKAGISRVNQPGLFNPAEINYMLGVYGNISSGSLKNLDELLQVMTAGQLRMSDDERLGAIDRIYAELEDQLGFTRQFGGSCSMLALARTKEKNQLAASAKLYGIQN